MNSDITNGAWLGHRLLMHPRTGEGNAHQKFWLLLAGAALSAFAIALALAESASFAATDQSLSAWIRAGMGERVLHLVQAISYTSESGYFAEALVLVGLVGLVLLRRWWSLILLVAAAGGAGLLEVATKAWIPEPAFWHATPRFPSGHALASFVLFAVLAYILWQFRPRVLAVAGVTIVMVPAVLVGLSALTFHQPTDVLGGYALGGAWLSLLVRFLGLRVQGERERRTSIYPALAVAVLLPVVAVGGWKQFSTTTAAGGITCGLTTPIGYHVHAHLTVIAGGQFSYPPAGIGLHYHGLYNCWMHTHWNTGLIHIEAPHRYVPTLGSFFALWGEPLSRHQVGRFHVAPGQLVRVYVNQRRYSGNPATIRLPGHTDITLEIGPPFRRPPTSDFSGI